MRFCLRTVVVTFVSLFTLGTLVFGQSANTSLRGTVTDPKGAVVFGCDGNPRECVYRVFAHREICCMTVSISFLKSPPATYVLTVTVAGFATIKQDNVTLQVQPATLDMTLQVAGTTEVVEVSGAAPLVNATDASQGNVFNSIQLTSLPSEGRDPVSILSLQPGVTFLGNSTNFDNTKPNLVADSRVGSVAGARSDQTNVTVDGLDNNDQVNGYAFQGALRVPLDSIQEFRVTTTNSNADSGALRRSGEHGDQERYKQVPWHALRIQPLQYRTGKRLVQQAIGNYRRGAEQTWRSAPQYVRSMGGRANQERPPVLFRRL